jgi:hypothetical protein
MMTSAQYGHIIKHLEVSHLDALPVLRLRENLREPFGKKAKKLIEMRDQAHSLVNEAEKLFGEAFGELDPSNNGSNGFTVRASDMIGFGHRFEAYRHNPLARAAESQIRMRAIRIESLVELVEDVFVPGRFKHVYGPEGIPYLDSAQILEIAPDIKKRVLSLRGERRAGYLVERGTLLIPCSGQLHGIIGSVVLAGEWHEEKVLTNHIMRIVPKKNPDIQIGYLQAVLSHPTLGRPRVIKSAFGSSVPELGPAEISRLSIPRLEKEAESDIADRMEQAARLRSDADALEDEISSEADDYVDQFLDGKHDSFEL